MSSDTNFRRQKRIGKSLPTRVGGRSSINDADRKAMSKTKTLADLAKVLKKVRRREREKY